MSDQQLRDALADKAREITAEAIDYYSDGHGRGLVFPGKAATYAAAMFADWLMSCPEIIPGKRAGVFEGRYGDPGNQATHPEEAPLTSNPAKGLNEWVGAGDGENPARDLRIECDGSNDAFCWHGRISERYESYNDPHGGSAGAEYVERYWTACGESPEEVADVLWQIARDLDLPKPEEATP